MAIKASNLILSVRQKLNDKEPARYKFTTPEVVDAINMALAVISNDLLFFNRTWEIKCNKEKARYRLPADFVKIISIKLNGKKIDNIKSLEAYESMSDICSKPVAIIDNISLRVYDVTDDDKIIIEYNYIEHIDDENSEIDTSLLLSEPIVLYAASVLFQNPVFKDGLQRSVFHANAFFQKMEYVRSRLKNNSNSKNIRSQFRGV
ncbi:MAG: hypothetical protein PHI79_03490 [Sulfurovaceae bacterium]|nr:hypothetical protein [Sulfurovaceae bacterium]MDD5548645.1 hypothetical protein [Sulfurovaceae bacterium]